MPKQTMKVMLIVAIVSGLVVALGIYRMATGTGNKNDNTVPVVVASASLGRGTMLEQEHVRIASLPRAQLPLGAFFTEPRAVVGRMLRDRIGAGSPIIETALVPNSDSPLLGTLVKSGYRAVGVAIDARGEIQQSLRAGDRVDVVVTVEDEEGITSSKTLLQDVEVLAVNSSGEAKQDKNGIPTLPVTLAVTPVDGERLSLAMQVGSVQLLVRAFADQQLVQTSGVTKDTLLPPDGVLPYEGQREDAAGEQRSVTYRLVELIEGQQRTKKRFLNRPSSGADGALPQVAPSKVSQ